MKIKDDRFVLARRQKRRLLKLARKTNDAALRTRCMIVLHTADGFFDLNDVDERDVFEVFGQTIGNSE